MRIIGHIDMDAFFAAIEERDSPQFKGMPIVVGADPKEGTGRGVVSTANYEARKFGIHSAMPISRAWQLAEKGRLAGGNKTVFLPPNMKRYTQVSGAIMDIVRKYVKIIEQVSVDEAYMDLSLAGTYKKAEEISKRIKKDIYNNQGLTASVGIGPNKLISKIASDFQKPNGLTIVTHKKAKDFIAGFDIRKIPGIGPKTEDKFKAMGVNTVLDMRKFSEADLYELMGEWGLDLFDKIWARDDSELITEWTPKSVGEQETFEEDILDAKIIIPRLKEMSESVFKSMKDEGFKKFGRIVLTVRFEDLKTVSRSKTIEGGNPEVIKNEISKMILPFFDSRENPRKKKLRLIGLRVEDLK